MEITEETKEQLNDAIAALKTKQEPQEEPKEEIEITREEKQDPFLDEAVKMGYDPNYSGPNKKSPEQFVKDGSFFKKIADQNKKIDDLTRLINESYEHNKKLEKASYEKALRELKAAKEEAEMMGDIQKYKVVSEQENIVAKQMEEVSKKPEVKQEVPFNPTPELLDFKERNKHWFNAENEDLVMEATAIDQTIGAQLARKGQKISQADHLRLVENSMAKLHPELFENKNQEKAPKTIRSTGASTGEKLNLASRLTKAQKDYIKSARSYGSKLTDEEYAKQLEKVGDLRDE